MKVTIKIPEQPIKNVLQKHGYKVNEVNMETCRSEIEIMLNDEYSSNRVVELEELINESIVKHELGEFLDVTPVKRLKERVEELHEAINRHVSIADEGNGTDAPISELKELVNDLEELIDKYEN